MADQEKTNAALASAARKTFVKSFDATLQLAPDEGGAVWIDGAASPPVVLDRQPKGAAADCVWRGAREVLLRALGAERALESAYVAGRIQISGDMSVMTRLEFGEQPGEQR